MARKVRRCDDEELLDWWRTLAREAPDMRLVELKERSRGRFLAAIARWGTWQAVSERAGVGSWPRIERAPWTKQRIVDEMRALAARGRPVSDDQNLYVAAKRHFGSLAAAAALAGVKARAPRRRDRAEVLAGLREIARRHGKVTSALVEEAGLRSAVERQFGGLTPACSAAGVAGFRQSQAINREKRYSREAALAALRKAASSAQLVARRDLPHLVHQALLRHFGSLRAAREAAGLPPPPPRPRRWNVDRVLSELRREHRKGTRLTLLALRDAGRGDLVSAIRDVIGSLPAARRLARLPDPAPLRPARGGFEKLWDEALVIAEIRDRADTGHPLAYSKAPRTLVSAGVRYFGSWQLAIEAAGLDYAAVRLNQSCTDDDLLALLRRLHATRPGLTFGELGDLPIASTLCRRFGTLQAAAELAGFTDWPARISHPALSRRATRAALRARLAASLPITRAAVAAGDPPLAFSVSRVHPVWAEALARLGFRTPKTDRYWNRERVVSTLATRLRTGRPVIEDRVRTGDPELHEAATRWFGSFIAALAAAGDTVPDRRARR